MQHGALKCNWFICFVWDKMCFKGLFYIFSFCQQIWKISSQRQNTTMCSASLNTFLPALTAALWPPLFPYEDMKNLFFWFPKTAGHCSFSLKQEEIAHLLGTIFSISLIHIWCYSAILIVLDNNGALWHGGIRYIELWTLLVLVLSWELLTVKNIWTMCSWHVVYVK